MPETSKTAGELVFERYLNFQHIPFEFEKEHPGKSKRPDFTIEGEGRPIVFDVKDFEPNEGLPMGMSQFDPYPPIREKIDQGRDKFKQFKEYCCSLVLFNAGRQLVFLDSPMVMLGSMYGDSGFTFPFNTETGIGDASQTKQAFLGRGKMIRLKESKVQNTTLSAIITVDIIRPFMMQMADLIAEDRTRDWETELREKIPGFDPNLEVPRVIVWHNAVARISFPANLFCGDYDTHYGIMAVEQGVTYEGSALPDRLKLSESHNRLGRRLNALKDRKSSQGE